MGAWAMIGFSSHTGMMPTMGAAPAAAAAAPSDAIQAAMAATLGTIQLPNAGPSPVAAAPTPTPTTPVKSTWS